MTTFLGMKLIICMTCIEKMCIEMNDIYRVTIKILSCM